MDSIPFYNINRQSYSGINRNLEQDVGNYLRLQNDSDEDNSNALRHQYASAIYSQKYGVNKAKLLGDLNELIFQGSYSDTKIDQFNNHIGREYALKYPNYSKEEMIKKLYEDIYQNYMRRQKELGY